MNSEQYLEGQQPATKKDIAELAEQVGKVAELLAKLCKILKLRNKLWAE